MSRAPVSWARARFWSVCSAMVGGEGLRVWSLQEWRLKATSGPPVTNNCMHVPCSPLMLLSHPTLANHCMLPPHRACQQPYDNKPLYTPPLLASNPTITSHCNQPFWYSTLLIANHHMQPAHELISNPPANNKPPHATPPMLVSNPTITNNCGPSPSTDPAITHTLCKLLIRKPTKPLNLRH